jgi:hypothetical protein
MSNAVTSMRELFENLSSHSHSVSPYPGMFSTATINPTLLVQTEYGKAMCFSGEDVGKFLDLIKRATFLEKDYHEASGWRPIAPDARPSIPMEILIDTPTRLNHSQTIAQRLEDALQILRKHEDLIKGAEALNPDTSVPTSDSTGSSPF